MKINMEVDIDENKYQAFKNIIEEKHLSLSGIMEVVMIKTISEKGIDWLASTIRNEIATKNEKKKKAIELFRRKGFNIKSCNNNTPSD